MWTRHISSLALVASSLKWWGWRKWCLRASMSWGWFILTHESGVCLLNLYPVMLWSEFGPGWWWYLHHKNWPMLWIKAFYPSLLKQMVKRLPLSKRPSSVISLQICHFISIIQIQRAVRPHHRELEVSLAHFFYPITMDLSLPPSTLPLVFFFFFWLPPCQLFL